MQECKVRVVTDQKRVFPLDGEHVHFMQATDKSVTSMTFEPDGHLDDEDSQEPEQSDAFDEYEIQVTDSVQRNEPRAMELDHSEEFLAEPNEDTPISTDTNDFREKIKRRLQKALLGKKK